MAEDDILRMLPIRFISMEVVGRDCRRLNDDGGDDSGYCCDDCKLLCT